MKKSLLLLILFFPLLTSCLTPSISTSTPKAEITQITNEFPITTAPVEMNKSDAPDQQPFQIMDQGLFNFRTG
jgi:hypothetical protein